MAGLRIHGGWELHPGVRTGARLSPGERAADAARDALGSWVCAGAVAIATAVAVVLALRHDGGAGPVAVLAVALAGLALVELSVLLMAVRRHHRTAGERALHDLDTARRAEAAAEELAARLERLHTEVARLSARLEASRRPHLSPEPPRPPDQPEPVADPPGTGAATAGGRF